MRNKLQYQTVELKVPSGVNSVFEARIPTDNFYDRVTGISIIPLVPVNDFSTVPQVSIGLSDNNGTIQDRTHIADYLSDTSIKHVERYKPIDAPAKGNDLKISVESLTGAFAADFNFHVVLRLIKN